jgi:hypothetical protein
MSTSEDTNQASNGSAPAGGWRVRWKKVRLWIGAIVTTAVVIPLVTWGVTSGREWISDKFNPKPYLQAAVAIPSPASGDGGEGWVFDKPPRQLPLPPESGDVDGWATANGGIPASGNYIEVTLQGLNGHNVVVHDISVNIVSRTDPPKGTYVTIVRQRGPLGTYQLGLDLDATPVSVTAEPDKRLPHVISGSQPETLRLGAITSKCTCEWTGTLRWSADDGKQGATEITDKGHPFRVAASTRATSEKVGWGRNGWGVLQD